MFQEDLAPCNLNKTFFTLFGTLKCSYSPFMSVPIINTLTQERFT